MTCTATAGESPSAEKGTASSAVSASPTRNSTSEGGARGGGTALASTEILEGVGQRGCERVLLEHSWRSVLRTTRRDPRCSRGSEARYGVSSSPGEPVKLRSVSSASPARCA